MTIRKRLEDALSGKEVTRPVYVAYDWFVNNRDIDWQKMFDLGMGQINHANIVKYEWPNLEIKQIETQENGHLRKDVYWITDIGELHEWFIDEWRQEYLIKEPKDYRIMARAHEDITIAPTNEYFDKSEEALGNRGITIGQFGDIPAQSRNAFQRIQIDFAGLERFSIDIALEVRELIELIELMNEIKLREVKCSLKTRATQIKLWENLSIETMGPNLYRRYLVPVYKEIFNIISDTNKKLQVHYDGKLQSIADDIAELDFDGVDSLTAPPEGDLEIAQARKLWPDKFFWIHPSLDWFGRNNKDLIQLIKKAAEEAGPYRYCFELSEEIPPRWNETLPIVLKTLQDF